MPAKDQPVIKHEAGSTVILLGSKVSSRVGHHHLLGEQHRTSLRDPEAKIHVLVGMAKCRIESTDSHQIGAPIRHIAGEEPTTIGIFNTVLEERVIWRRHHWPPHTDSLGVGIHCTAECRHP